MRPEASEAIRLSPYCMPSLSSLMCPHPLSAVTCPGPTGGEHSAQKLSFGGTLWSPPKTCMPQNTNRGRNVLSLFPKRPRPFFPWQTACGHSGKLFRCIGVNPIVWGGPRSDTHKPLHCHSTLAHTLGHSGDKEEATFLAFLITP